MLRGEKKNKRRDKGFTLIEMVIVVAILAILVGILAPQYTKYVEKARKSADASNMEEMVRAIETYELDGTHQLTATGYELIIGYKAKGGTSAGTALNTTEGNVSDDGLQTELNKQFPDWQTKMLTKSKKWGDNGTPASIVAKITITSDGGFTVTYSPKKFADYMQNGGD